MQKTLCCFRHAAFLVITLTVSSYWLPETFSVCSITNDARSNHRRRRNHRRQCETAESELLANKSIVFIGDSRVRYQYMSLVHFLTYGYWNDCENGTTLFGATHCEVIHYNRTGEQKDGVNYWNTWYKNTNDIINSHGSSELCDCYRPSPFDAHRTRENRYFWRDVHCGKIRISYLQNFLGQVTFRNDFPPFQPDPLNTTCKPGKCDQADITLPLLPALEIVSKLQPTHVFAGTGWHDIDIGCTLVELERDHRIKTYFMTRICERGGSIQKTRQGCNASIFDRMTPTCGLPSDFYWDKMHGLSTINNDMNQRLFDLLNQSEM